MFCSLQKESTTTNYKIAAEGSNLVVAENVCGTEHHPLGCSSLFVRLAELIMEDIHLELLRNTDEAQTQDLQLVCLPPVGILN